MTEKKTTTTAQKQPDGIITTQRNGQTIVAEFPNRSSRPFLLLKIKKEGYHVEEKTTDHHRGM